VDYSKDYERILIKFLSKAK